MIVAPYIGIDESNHGRWPEIYVAAFSNNPEDITPAKKKMSKRRGGRIFSQEESQASFRHIIIPQEYQMLIHNHEGRGVFYKFMKIVVFSEFVRSFRDVQLVLIDGEVLAPIIEEVQRKVYSRGYKPRIIAEAGADRKYPLVNYADYLAYILYNHYNKTPHVEDKTLQEIVNSGNHPIENLITPRLENYLDVIERL